ncbi:epimerase [Mesorhizobium loti]|nr:NmrA family NAD(P)-binding protein [Mesorhizobium loti]PLP60458.1 epimerase [Mesorhizobium loti]
MSDANRKTILVVGASGRSGGYVAAELARRGVVVRALVRNTAAAQAARANGASEIASGDLRDTESLDGALKGVHGVYHVGPPFVADEPALGTAMVDAARRARVGKFVFSSVIHPANGLANHASKLPVEEALLRSNLDYTILYPATLFQNIAPAWQAVIRNGLFAEPFSNTARLARVDYHDVAEVAAEALTGDRLAYGSFELAADGMHNRIEIAALMSALLGRPIEPVELSFKEWKAVAMPPFEGEALAQLERVFESYTAFGSAGNSLTLRAILGREPRTLRRYLEELATAHPD